MSSAPLLPMDVPSHRLLPQESLRIFNDRIVPDEFTGIPASPSPQPLAVLLVGQTGAGKSNLAPAVLEGFQKSSRTPAHFIADTYKTYHPSYAGLIQSPEHQRLASPATSPDARLWLAMAAREATKRGVDVVLESACREPTDFTELARIFRDAGYRVEVLVLAVPAPVSRLGLMVRYFKGLPEAQSKGLPVRLTPVKIHDASFQGLLEVARFLETSDVADQVLVIRRGNLVAHGQEKDKTSGKITGIANALSSERMCPLNGDELRRARDDLEFLSQFNQVASEVDLVRGLLKQLNNPGNLMEEDSFSRLQPLQLATSEVPKGDRLDTNILRMGLR